MSATRKRLLRHPGIRLGGTLVLVVVLLAVFGPAVAPQDPLVQDIAGGLSDYGEPLAPSAHHWLGTDPLGRDILSRLLVGARVSLLVGVAATLIALLIGVTIGLVSGYYKGMVDLIGMRMVDVVMSFPFLLLCLALVGIWGKRDITVVFVVLGLVGWTTMARVVRGKVLAEREKDYVEAARALGFSSARIVFRHLLPNVVGPVLVLATLGVAGSILAESVLSYLGVGVPPPTPSWGAMISEGQPWYRLAPQLIFLPGMLILITVLGFNLLGEGLRDVLDPRD